MEHASDVMTETAVQDAAGARRVGREQRSVFSLQQVLVSAPGAILFSLWAWIHIGYFLDTGRPVGLIFAVQEIFLAVLFLVRRPARDASRRPMDWAIAMFGSFGALLTRPGGQLSTLTDVAGPIIQLIGLGVALTSLFYLRRSFGMVAAHRGLVTTGLYGMVRHPMYLGYFIGQIGYLIQSPTSRNLAVIALVCVCQIVRIRAEENLLSKDVVYVAYKQHVPARLVPGVW